MMNGPEPYELTEEDRRILDRLAESGFDRSRLETLSAGDRARAERVLGLLELLHDYPVEDGDDTLVHATMARIDRAEDERAARMAFDMKREEAAVGPRRIRLPDFVTVAAVILILVGVFGPVAAHVRHRSIDTSCANNLRQVGYAFSNYAAENDNAMPVALAGPQYTWDTLANVINLAPLLAGQYCEHEHLQCPGCREGSDASYSYQWQLPVVRPTWGAGPGMTLVLGDRNPLIDAHRSGRDVPPLSISANHGGRGQNVLRSDGSSMWLVNPVVGRSDNIWLPRGLSRLQRGAQPADQADVFLAH